MSVYKLKACYKKGAKIDRNKQDYLDNNYTANEPMAVYDDLEYSVLQSWRRINSSGRGVSRAIIPLVIMNIDTVDGGTSVKIEYLNDSDSVTMSLLCPVSNESNVSFSGELREMNVYGSSRSVKSIIQILGHQGIFYEKCWNELITQAVAYASTAEYIYANVWSSSAMWGFLMMSRSAKGADIANTTMYRAAQQGIVDLVTQHMAQGGNVDDITWYQALYYCINTKSQTKRIGEYVDAEAAQTWCEENAPDAVAKYF